MRLILPLGLPAIASLAIFQFLWTWNDLLVALTFGGDTQPITVAIFSQLRAVRLEHRPDRAGLVHLARDPAGRLLRVPALLRPGAAGRLGEVSRARRRDRRRRARGLRRVRDAAARRGRAGRDRRLRRPTPDPAAAWRRARGGDPPAADALGERRALPADVVPGARGPGGAAARSARAARRSASATATTRRSTSSSSTSARCASGSGWDESFRRPAGRAGAARSTAASSSTATGASPTCWSRPAIPGSRSRRSSRTTRAWCTRTSRTSTPTRSTVVGAGMAAATEWLNALAAGATVVSVRRREPVRRPLNVPRPLFSRRGLARFHAHGARGAGRRCCARCSAPSYPPGPRLGRAARAGDAEPLPRRGRA